MKKLILSIVEFIKRVGFISRLIGIVFVGYFLGTEAFPDLIYNFQQGSTTEISYEQLMQTPKEEIPRYLKIKDAVVPSGSYVEVRRKKDELLMHIYYPVFAISKEERESGAATLAGEAKLVVKDSKVKDGQLEDGAYFSSDLFSIEGKYDGSTIDSESREILSNQGYKISSEAILIERSTEAWSTGTSLILTFISVFILALLIASFLPSKVLGIRKKVPPPLPE